MSPTEVLVFVLALLGGEAKALPQIELVHIRPADASPTAEGYTRRGSNTIYLLTDTPVFQEALRSQRWDADGAPFVKLASIVMHEAWHVRNGPDERGAYEAQLFTLSRLGAGPGSDLHRIVYQSMQVVLKAQLSAPAPSSTATEHVAVMMPVPPRPDRPSWNAMRSQIAPGLLPH